MQKKWYYLYQITFLIDGKTYVGVHQTKNLDDGYMGSGTKVKELRRKYGPEFFEKKILRFFESEEEMYASEAEVVTPDFLLRDDVLNLLAGGKGYTARSCEQGREKHVHLLETDSEYRENWLNKVREAARLGRESINRMGLGIAHQPHLQKMGVVAALSPESREKRLKTFRESGHSKGEKNSQYGTFWITNGLENKKLARGSEIPAGYCPGRTCKKAKGSVADGDRETGDSE